MFPFPCPRCSNLCTTADGLRCNKCDKVASGKTRITANSLLPVQEPKNTSAGYYPQVGNVGPAAVKNGLPREASVNATRNHFNTTTQIVVCSEYAVFHGSLQASPFEDIDWKQTSNKNGHLARNAFLKEKASASDDNLHPWECEKCGRCFGEELTFDAHVQDDCDTYCFKCDICGWKYKSKAMFDVHLHYAGRPFRCDQCGFASAYVENLLAHKNTHYGRKYISAAY